MASDAHVSTGRLPAPERVQAWVEDAHARFAADTSGAVSEVYPALAKVPANLFGDLRRQHGRPRVRRGRRRSRVSRS